MGDPLKSLGANGHLMLKGDIDIGDNLSGQIGLLWGHSAELRALSQPTV